LLYYNAIEHMVLVVALLLRPL